MQPSLAQISVDILIVVLIFGLVLGSVNFLFMQFTPLKEDPVPDDEDNDPP